MFLSTTRRALAAFPLALFLMPTSGMAESQALRFDPLAISITCALLDGGSARGPILHFYRERGFAPLWTGGDASTRERLRVLHSALAGAVDHALPSDRFSPELLRSLLVAARDPDTRAKSEVSITRLYLDLAHALTSGVVDPRDVDSAVKREVKRRADGDLLRLIAKEDPGQGVRALLPSSPGYAAMLRQRAVLNGIVRSRDWTGPMPIATVRPGDTGPAVVALRTKLQENGLLRGNLSGVFGPEMQETVAEFQRLSGLEVDGVAGPDTIAALNRSPEDRLAAVTVSLERERWSSGFPTAGRSIVVNLPEFLARVMDDGQEVFVTRAVVGAVDDGKPTPEFSDEMTHIVVNPSWYVPPGIIRRDYLPKLQANPYALSAYEIVDRKGRPANRGAGFRQYTATNFPFSIRQKPGPENALGQVKFMFPNPWSIYLHDTPAKSLFDRDSRAYSSGCVRLADPGGFARVLLAPQDADPEERFRSAVAAGREQRINLIEPVPVHLIYRTAFTDARGRLQFRPDVYGRDAKLLALLEQEGVMSRPLTLADDRALVESDDAG